MAGTIGKILKINGIIEQENPRIGTSVFLKGCPLNCLGCPNSEDIDPEISIRFNQTDCISCSRCVVTCPEEALKMNGGYGENVLIDRLKCKVCGDCVKLCPTNAMQFTIGPTSP